MTDTWVSQSLPVKPKKIARRNERAVNTSECDSAASLLQLRSSSLGVTDWLWLGCDHMSGAVDHSIIQMGPAKASLQCAGGSE